MAQGESLPNRSRGSALFVDISGFTPLAEALGQQFGPQRGAEELTQYLNQVYDALIADLDRRRGSVIGFSGDAMTCWFDADDGLAATVCALEMQRSMQQFGAIRLDSGAEFPLTAKGGVAVGEASRFAVGDPELQLIDVLAGRLLDEMAEAEHHASGGELVLGPSALEALGERVELGERRGANGRQFGLVLGVEGEHERQPWPELPGDSLSEEQVRPWLLAPVFQRLRSGQGEFLAELRPAVALFLRFAGIDYDADEAAGEKLDDFVRRVQRTLASYEGTLVDITTGDKGSYLYMAFGAPIAHEDDVERAASAALDLRAAAAATEFLTTIQIGINRGRMRTGAYGGRTRRTYGVLGDATNLAARLMTAAEPGEILVTQSTADQTEQAFAWEPHPDITVKGKQQPVAVVGLLARSEVSLRDRPARRPLLPMVGREPEVGVLKEKLALVAEGHGQVLAVAGEAGMGKSRLVSEAVRSASELGFSIHRGEAKSYGKQSPYLIWTGIWRDIFDLKESHSLERQQESLRQSLEALEPSLLERLPLLGPLLNFSIPDNDLTRHFDAKSRKAALEAMVAELLRLVAQGGPIIWILEDAHWIDRLSAELLQVVGPEVKGLPTVILLAGRWELDETTELLPADTWPHLTRLDLAPLDLGESEQLIQLKSTQLFGEAQPPQKSFVERLVDRSEGNPFYIEEVLNYLKDHNMDPQDAEALSSLDLPVSLHSLVLSRIDELGERPRSALRVASVCGRSFTGTLLAGAYPELKGADGVGAELQELDRKGFIEVDARAADAYLFKQGVIREVAYESLPFKLRRTLHVSIADFIERTEAKSLESHTDLLAHHFFTGQAWAKALGYKLEAARGALRKYANQDAILSAQHALEAAENADGEPADIRPKALAAHEILGEVFTTVGQYDEALESYSAARAIVEGDPLPNIERNLRLGELFRSTAGVHERRSEFDAALEWVERGLRKVGDGNPSVELIRLLVLKAGIFSRLSRYDEATDWAKQSLQLANAEPTLEGRQAAAQVHYLLGGIYNRQGAFDRAVHHCESSVAVYQQIGDLIGQARAYNNLGSAHRVMGDWDQARHALHQSLDIARRIGDVQQVGFVTNNLGNIYLDQGEWEQAAEHFQESNSIWRRLATTLPEAATLSNLGEAYLRQGRLEESQAALDRARELYTQAGTDTLLPELERRWAQLDLTMRNFQRALAAIQRSIALARKQEAGFELGVSLRVRAEILLAQEQYQAAGEALDESLAILEKQNSDYEVARALVVQAKLAIAAGEAIDGQSVRWAIDTFERLGARHGTEEMARLTEKPEPSEF